MGRKNSSAPAGDGADKQFRDELVALLPSLRAFARGLCRHREMADDLAQDTMMRAWAARDSYTQGSNFRAWMFMIMRNQFYTTLRKNSRMASLDPEVAERVLVVDPAQQDGINVDDVAKALQKLPAEQREVLLLVGASGVSYEEASQIIGCAMGTVKSRLARGRAALALLIDGAADGTLSAPPRARAKLANRVETDKADGAEASMASVPGESLPAKRASIAAEA